MNEGSVIPWKDIALFLGAGSMILGALIAWVKVQLAPEFARKADIDGLSTRLKDVERQMQSVPSHADMTRLSERISAVERGVDVVGAEMRGVSAGVNRVEADLRLIKDHLLNHKDADR
ncbi:MAG: DUF2730 family protein [Beijerinckiaceae bacterium]|nr:DUF2730 family protein [Beijerinckiaceae bacterium]